MIVPVRKKVCKHCGKEKPISDFFKLASSPDGHQYCCKECARGILYKSREGERLARLFNYPDEILVFELKRRGWSGELKRTVPVQTTETQTLSI